MKLKISQGKNQFEIEVDESADSVENLKLKVQQETGLPPNLQKLLYKGQQLKDPEAPLESLKLKEGAKLILMASQTEDIAKVAAGAIVTKLLPQAAEPSEPKVVLSELTVLMDRL
jgi:hypothetical protein